MKLALKENYNNFVSLKFEKNLTKTCQSLNNKNTKTDEFVLHRPNC